ncbi:MAG: insulinase family protein [Chitinispirillaceae bacterium]|jgi:zinc protease|nr:insulinase family protein [Chitinispirillaceae bacterium]
MNFRYSFPPMHETRLANGLTLTIVPDHEQPGLVIALQIPVGRFSDPLQQEGLCELMIGLLSKGTESFTADEFSLRLESTGASLFSDTGEEHCVVGMRMRASSARSLIPLFVEMVARPRFDNEEFTRLRQEMVTSLQADAVDTSAIAYRHFYTELAGSGHPSGRFQTVASLKKITLGAIKEFFEGHCSQDGGNCVVAGDMDADTFPRFIIEQFSLWHRPRTRPCVIAPAASHARSPVVRIIDKSDITQTSLAIGQVSPGEKCPDKNALLLANYIFGGGNFSSRLMARIRTADGHTYGVSSQLLSETDFGAFLISTATRTGELGSVMAGIIDEYRRFCTDGVTADEFKKAQQFAIGNMAFQLEGIGNIVDKILWLRFYNRPNSYIERFEEIVTSIDLAAVNSAIKKHLSPDNLVIVAVGKKDEIESHLAPFGAIRHFHFRDTP